MPTLAELIRERQQSLDGYTDLGSMNGWKENPAAYLVCCRYSHEANGGYRYDRNGRVYCEECKITFEIDSTG